MKLRGGIALLAVLAGGPLLMSWSAANMPGTDEGLRLEIEELAEAESWDEVAETLAPYFAGGEEAVWAHHQYGKALLELKDLDKSAFHLDRAMQMMVSAGEDSGKDYRVVRGLLEEADPISGRRRLLFTKAKRILTDATERLLRDGHDAQTLDLLERLSWLFSPEEDAELIATLERLRVADQEVDLDAAGDKETIGSERPTLNVESKHYLLECNLEEEVTQAVGETMDDIFQAYVQIYLDGEIDRVPLDKAKIRIFGSWEHMVETYPGQAYTPGLGGWWSPSENKVTNYDTRERSGSLDEMLGTLFHEASHQFMTTLSKRGGWSPAWLNEGTACFFEGAKAMQDHRVLWPDAATSRLRSLAYMLPNPGGSIPTVDMVIGYDKPGSYPGEYYAFGWGLVYYFQEYEDPDTLAYVWRPYYQEYLQRVTTEGGHPRKLFDEVFLADGNPGGFEKFEDFAESWQDWIMNEVKPLHSGNQPRSLRLARVDKYLAAAEKAKVRKKGGVSEAELLERALRDLEHVRTDIDRIDIPDGDLIMQEIAVLERLDRDSAEAWMIQQVLDLADEGYYQGLDDETYLGLTARLDDINEDYRSMNLVRNRTRSLRKDFRKLLAEYEELGIYPLRSYTLAALAGDTLKDPELREKADELRKLASAGGTLAGTITPLAGEEWFGLWSAQPDDFKAEATTVTISKEDGPMGMALKDIEVSGEYEIRGKLIRDGEITFSSFHGVVVAASEEDSWLIVGIDRKGEIGLRNAVWSGDSVTLDKIKIRSNLEEPLEDDHDPQITIHVYPEGELTVTVDDQEPVEISLDWEMPRRAHPGIFTKASRTTLENFVIENYP
ncbi:MAG: hypothetical protein P1V81_12140 [Planctomycetota bacterium]|nr:hypothetical protein [Planctomycetota bacterium]